MTITGQKKIERRQNRDPRGGGSAFPKDSGAKAAMTGECSTLHYQSGVERTHHSWESRGGGQVGGGQDGQTHPRTQLDCTSLGFL
jgi:hypothetical protein